MKLALLIVGIIGAVLSLCVVGVSFGLHLANPRHISLDEAMWGIAPGSCCCTLFFIVAVAGLILALVAPKSETPPLKKRRADYEDEDE